MAKNLLEDLGFPPEEAAALKLKTDLHTKIVKCAARYSQGQLQAILDESQPRVSNLLRGKMSKFSLEMLVIHAEKLGLHTEIKIKRVRSRVAAAGLALPLYGHDHGCSRTASQKDGPPAPHSSQSQT